MKITIALSKLVLLAALSASLIGLTGCGGNGAKPTATEVDAFNGNSEAPEAKAAAQRMREQDAQQAARSQAAANEKPAPPQP